MPELNSDSSFLVLGLAFAVLSFSRANLGSQMVLTALNSAFDRAATVNEVHGTVNYTTKLD